MAELAILSDAKRRLLQKYLRGEMAAGSDAIVARRENRPTPLSLAQEQLWRRSRVPGIPALYNESITVRRSGALEVAALERAMAEVIRRHEIWRTSYGTLDGEPVQVVHPAPATFPLAVADLEALSAPERESEVLRIAVEQAHRPFDLEGGPLLRATLVRMAEQEYRLVMTAHLSIVDGVSVYQVFPSELARLYEAFSTGKPSPMPDPPIQYGDFAGWQREWLHGAEFQTQVEYWRRKLAGPRAVLQWPHDHPRPSCQTFRGSIQPFVLSARLVDSLKHLSQEQGVTLFACLEAGLVALLHRYTGQDDMIVGTFSPAGRKRSEVQGLLGHFLNPVALRFNLAADPLFRDLLRQAQRVTAEAISYDDVPVQLLAQELLTKEDPSRHPFFTVGISLQPRTPSLPGWSVTSMDAESGGAFWDLYLAFIEQPGGIAGRAQYNPDLFEATTIAEVIGDLENVLIAASERPELSLSSLQTRLLSTARLRC